MSQDTRVGPDASAKVEEAGATRRLVSAGAVMAAGTALSRVLGFVRLIVLVYLFGNATRQADMFAIANTLPNSMYILLAGGVLNTVLVPQLVRAVRRDADGGEAYTNRVMTIGLLGLGLVTVALTLAVPLVVALYSGPGWKAPGLDAQYASMTALAYWCMPQVFFYGVHVLAGQVLNARDRFGPMMWAPIANNVVSVAVLGLFAVVFGRTDTGAAFTTSQEVVLGLGATLGIAVQAVVLVPFLRSAGYRFRPRLDLKGTGLGHTFRLARWTLGFVAVTQLALVVVNRLATEATVSGRGAGLTAYANAYAVWILPHSLVTVSLATAMLPSASRLGAAGDLRGVAAETTRTIRLAVTVLLPVAVGFVALGLPAAQLAFGFGRGGRDASFVGWTLMALALGLVPFTVQYVVLRAFYALEDTRTTFFLQLVIAAVNVVAAVGLIALVQDEDWVAPVLGLAYSLAYVVGALVSFRRLRRTLPDLEGHSLVALCVRLLAAALPAAALAWVVCWAVTSRLGSRPALFLALVLAGVVAVGVFLVLARLLRVSEVTQLTRVLRRRGGSPATDLTGSEPTGPVAEEEVDTEVRGRRDPVQTEAEAATASAATGSSEENGDSATLVRPGAPSIGAPPTTPAAALDRGDESAASGRSEDDGMTQTAIAPLRADEELRTDEDASSEVAPDEFLHVPTAAALPTGTVLAARYRLEELIADSRPSVTWRAFDEVLSRSVLVHVLAPGDPDEPELMAAARRASVATDSRFLRVLDAVSGGEAGVGSYIVCEYATGQSLEVLLSQAPLSGLEAAWVVREVADALSGVHGLGLHHRRVNPENVIVTPSGNVKIVGLLIDAVLRPNRSTSVPGADTGELVDVADLGRLLYAALVSRWPGGPAYSLPAAPRLGRRWMTPRQVRAGVSPALDNVCDQVLGDPPRHHAPQITTAHQLVQALTKVLGTADASGDLERRLHQPIPVVHHGPRRVPSAAADPDTGAPPVSALLDQPTEEMTAIRPARPGTPAAPAHTRRPAAEAPVSRPRSVPLAASGAAGVTQAVTTPVRPTAAQARPAAPAHPRRWVAVLLALCLVLVVAGTVSAQVLSRRLAGSAAPAPSAAAPTTSSPTPTGTPSGQVVRVVSARDFDPQGDTREENRDEVPLAVDGKDSTRWTTVTYKGNPRLGGIKRGVGLVLDLGEAQQVGSVRLRLSGDGTDVELRVPADDPARTTTPPMGSDKSWRKVASRSDAGSSATLTPDQPVTTRFVLVYLTSLPREGSGYRGGIYEAEVRS